MTARRQARGRDTATVVSGAGGIPRVFLLRCCIDVWAETPGVRRAQDKALGIPDRYIGGMTISDMQSADRRFSQARIGWLDAAGIMVPAERWKTIAGGGPYSVADLTGQGRAEAAADRFARAGCRVEDIPQLRREAEALVRAGVDEGEWRDD